MSRFAHGLRRRLLVTTSSAVGSLTLAFAAEAAAPPAPAPAADTQTAQVQEVVVTARKTSENLQRTPVAVTAVSNAELKARSIASVADLTSVVPSLHAAANAFGGSNSMSFFLRGVGQIDVLPTTDPGVGVYIDGIYLARTTGQLFDLADIAQVDVLRGPQGTLFGKNTEGGAISVTTRRPTGALDGFIDATFGSFNRRDVKAGVEFPIIADTLAGSLAIASRNDDGYAKSTVTGDGLAAHKDIAVRGSLNYTGPHNSSFYATADYSDANDTNPPGSILAIYPSTTESLFFSLVVPTAFPGRVFNSSLVTADPLKPAMDASDRNHLRVGGVSGIGSIQFGSLTLKSLTALRGQNDYSATNTGFFPIPIFDNTRRIRETQFTQEFQAIGSALDGRLKYVGGVFFEHEAASMSVLQNYLPGLYNAMVAAGYNPTLPNVAPCASHCASDASANGFFSQKDDSYAAFVNTSFKLTEKLSLSAGLRYSVERKSIKERDDYIQQPTSLYVNPVTHFYDSPGTIISGSKSWESGTPTVGLQYQATRDAFFYATFSKGFKSGGFDGRPLAKISAPDSFNPEKVTNYEVGSKLELFERRLRINTALFRANYDDLTVQALVLQPNGLQTNQITNAGDAVIKGIEMEVTAVPVAGLELSAKGSYNDVHLVKLNPGATFSLSDHIIDVPAVTANFSAAYTQHLTAGASLAYRADYVFTSKVYNAFPNTFCYNAANTAVSSPCTTVGAALHPWPDQQKAYGLLNARITYAFDARRLWTVSVFGTNLADTRFKTYGFSSATVGSSTAFYGPPRQLGVEITHKFQ